jgi:hypothetical protein
MKKTNKINIGDEVFVLNNSQWGRDPMIVKSILEDGGKRALCCSQKFSCLGFFFLNDLVKRDSEKGEERERALASLKSLEEAVSGMVNTLFCTPKRKYKHPTKEDFGRIIKKLDIL